METATIDPAAPGVDARRVLLTSLEPGDNPRRKKPAPDYVSEIAASMRAHDVIEPLIVRLHPKHAGQLQIVCGETRFMAAKEAGLVDVPVVVRDYDDLAVLEVQLIENLQRASMHPIDEGAAFRRLIDSKKHTAESLAAKVGKSIRWIYQRIEFTKLIPDLQQAFIADRLNTKHAERLTRLDAADQAQCAKDGLWDTGLWDDDDPKERKAVSPARLDDWIRDHVKLSVEGEQVDRLLPEIAEAREEAITERGQGILQVARAHMVPQHTPALKKRFEGVILERSWKPAGGRQQCEHAQRAVIVFGQGQGQLLDVCVAKKQCAKHWPGHQAAAKAKRATGSGTAAAAAQREQLRHQREIAQQDRQRQHFRQFTAALQKDVFAAASRLSTVPMATLHAVLAYYELPQTRKVADLPKILLLAALKTTFDRAWSHDKPKMLKWARLLGVNAAKIEKSTEPAKPETKADPKPGPIAGIGKKRDYTKPAKRKAGQKK